MTAFGSKLNRRMWQPFLWITVAAIAGAIVFTLFPNPSPLWIWAYTILFLLVVLTLGALLCRRVVSSVQGLARAAEQMSPETFEKASQHPDEITALTQTISSITTEMREKEQTWMGDLERRNQAAQQMSRILQEQAASFETALNSVDLPVCLFESDGNILQVNQRFCQFLGITAENLKPLGFLPIVSKLRKLVAAPEELTEVAEAIYRKPSTPRDINFPLTQGRGTLRVYCVPIFGELSSLVGLIISPRESPDASVVDRLKGEFISTVSHELRTPLTAIKGALGLILGGAGGPVPGAIRDLLEIASNNTERLIQLVNDILDIFRMEAGKLQLTPAPTDALDLIQRACARVEKEAAAAGVRLETRVAPGTPPILVDAEQVRTVLEKLISNAIKFSTRESAVRVGAEPMPENPNFLVFAVQDFGKGIPQEAQEKIFEKFEQAENVMTRQHQGPGLGLAICRGVVEAHGGRIWVKSEPGKGSTFYVSLPVAQPEMVRKPSEAAGPATSPKPSKVYRLVMVVEDDADTRSVISRMLQSEGHFVIEVGSGSQVAALAVRHQPELIALDLLLPDVKGLEVLRALKANDQTRQIPVICISISDDLSSRALQLGAAQFIRKPLEAATLLDAIHTVFATAASKAG